MPITEYSDSVALRLRASRVFAGTAFADFSPKPPLVLAGLFYPVGGAHPDAGYGLSRAQFDCLTQLDECRNFFVWESEATSEAADAHHAHAYQCIDVSYRVFDAAPLQLAVNTAYLHTQGRWAVMVSEESVAAIATTPEFITRLHKLYPRMQEELDLCAQHAGDMLAGSAVAAVIDSVRSHSTRG